MPVSSLALLRAKVAPLFGTSSDAQSETNESRVPRPLYCLSAQPGGATALAPYRRGHAAATEGEDSGRWRKPVPRVDLLDGPQYLLSDGVFYVF